MKKTIFKSILISYLLIGTFIIILNLVSFGNYYFEVKENLVASTEYKANHIADYLDSNVRSIQKYLDALSVSGQLEDYVTNHDMPESAVVAKRLKEELMQATILDKCNHLMVFSLQENSVFVTPGRNYNRDMLSTFVQQYDISYEEMLKIVHFKGVSGYHIFSDGRAWIMRPVLLDTPEIKAVVAAEVELDILLHGQAEQSEGDLILLKDNETVVYSTGGSVDIHYDNQQEKKSNESIFVLDGKKYMSITSQTKVFGYNVEIGIPTNELNRSILRFWLIVGSELAVSVLLIAIVSFILAHRTYKPVKKVINILDAAEDKDDYDWDSLLRRTKTLIDRNRALQKNEKETKEIVLGKNVSHILRGHTKDTTIIRKIMLDWIQLKENIPYIMAIVHLESHADSSLVRVNNQSELEKDLELEYFALKNVLDELVFEKYGGGMVSLEHQYVLFVTVSSEEAASDVGTQLQKVIDSFDKYLGSNVEIVVSNVNCGYDCISNVYKELKREMEYCHFWKNTSEKKLVHYVVDLNAEGQTINYAEYLDSNRRLMNYLEAEDYNRAYKTLEDMCNNIFSKDKRYFMYNKYRMYGAIALLTLSLDIKRDKGDLAFFQQLNYEEKLFQVMTMEQLVEVSKELFEEIISYEEHRDQGERQPGWVEKVIAYIETHYQDETLSVAMIADEFDFSVSYFSRTFKGYTGIGVLETIHKMRIKKAKELLGQGTTIKETAKAVGYLDSKALTRSFKKYEGITCEQFVKIALGE